jgi:hypothetical protein
MIEVDHFQGRRMPLPYAWDGEVMRPLPAFAASAAELRAQKRRVVHGRSNLRPRKDISIVRRRHSRSIDIRTRRLWVGIRYETRDPQVLRPCMKRLFRA